MEFAFPCVQCRYLLPKVRFWARNERRPGSGPGQHIVRQREGVENVLHSDDEVLPPVEFIGHRRGDHASSGVQMPQGFARGWIESQHIAGVIGAEEEMPSRCKNSGLSGRPRRMTSPI